VDVGTAYAAHRNHFWNIAGDIAKVSHRDGATLVETKAGDPLGRKWGFTIGSVITTSSGVTTEDYLFMHEYGHYMQSQLLGPFYMPVVAFPSLASAAFSDGKEHHNFYTERWANHLAAEHFGEDYKDYLNRLDDYYRTFLRRSSGVSASPGNIERTKPMGRKSFEKHFASKMFPASSYRFEEVSIAPYLENQILSTTRDYNLPR